MTWSPSPPGEVIVVSLWYFNYSKASDSPCWCALPGPASSRLLLKRIEFCQHLGRRLEKTFLCPRFLVLCGSAFPSSCLCWGVGTARSVYPVSDWVTILPRPSVWYSQLSHIPTVFCCPAAGTAGQSGPALASSNRDGGSNSLRRQT